MFLKEYFNVTCSPFNWIAKIFKYIFHGAQTSVCVTNYVHISNAVLYSFIHKSAAVRFFEYAANSAGGERLRREGETSHSRGETGDIILLNES